jgi:hypothetical protein
MQSYPLWTHRRSWGDYDVVVEKPYLPAIRSLFPADWEGENLTITPPEFQLIPEPDGPRGPSSVSVRTGDHTIGYLEDEVALRWAGVIRRIVGSGYLPTTSGRIWGNEWEGWDGLEFNTSVRIALGRPVEALPINEPPELAFTMLPPSSTIQVTKEDEHFDVLRQWVPAGGYGVLFVTLHERTDGGRAKPHVEIRVNDERVGQLTPSMSQRFLPMIEHLADRGLVTGCWGDITGSAVAAEVRIDGIKANEATTEFLDGTPLTIPPLIPESVNPDDYDITAMRPHLTPLPLREPTVRPSPPEPPDGSLVRFDKSRGRYNYVAVKRGVRWETTATGDWGSINEVMLWEGLARRVRSFEIATQWAPIDLRSDLRVRQHRAVIRFSIGGRYLAAINVCDNSSTQGEWYTTITDDAEIALPFGDRATWSDIVRYSDHIQVVAEWQQVV